MNPFILFIGFFMLILVGISTNSKEYSVGAMLLFFMGVASLKW